MNRQEFAAIVLETEVRQQVEALPGTLEIYWDEFQDWDAAHFRAAMRKATAEEYVNGFPPAAKVKAYRVIERSTPEGQARAFEESLSIGADEANALLDEADQSGSRALSREVDVFNQPRVRCTSCQDSGMRIVFHPVTIAAAKRGQLTIAKLRTCAVACTCDKGSCFSTQPSNALPVYNHTTMLEKPQWEINQQTLVDLVESFVSTGTADMREREQYQWQP